MTSRNKTRFTFFGIFLLTLASLILDFSGYYNNAIDWVQKSTGMNIPKMFDFPFKLGLDLQGGSQLIYEADKSTLSRIAVNERSSALQGVRDVIERRVNTFGVSEPMVQTAQSGDEYRIIVELAGVY